MTVKFIVDDSAVERVAIAKLLMPMSIEEKFPLPEPQVEMPPGIELSPPQAIVQSGAGPGELPNARTPQDMYLDQIRARIDRAWSDSKGARLAVGKCRVGIRQANTGVVTDVEFMRCLSTEGWKQSLAQAIRYASPLPAPPDEKLFSAEIVWSFSDENKWRVGNNASQE